MTTNVLSNQEKCRGAVGFKNVHHAILSTCWCLEVIFAVTLVEANVHCRRKSEH